MDAFLVQQIVSELSAALRGAVVSKIHQPQEREILLTLWTGREEKRLLLSAHPELCRIHLTTRRAPNPPVPPSFCQFLRRHLEGMRVAGLAAAPFDRLVRIEFSSSRPDALHGRTALVAELYGRHANLIYLDGEDTILAPLRPVPPEESRVRQLAAGIPYRPLPKPERIFLPEVTEADAARLHSTAWEGLPRLLLQEISGLGQELAHEAAGLGKEGPPALYAAIRMLVRRYEEGESEPGIGTLPTGKRRLLPFPCPAAGFSRFVPFPTANEAADSYYGEVAAAKELAVLRQQLRSRLSSLLRKERNKLDNVEGDEERIAEGLSRGAQGEILKTHLSSLHRGMTEFRGIPLDPAKSPVENMNRLFRLHKKAKGAVEIVRKRKREVAETVYYLESLEAQLAEAGTREELIAVRQELSASFAERKTARKGSSGKARGAGKTVRSIPPQVERLEFRGHTLLLGRNNAGNDRIVRDLSDPEDLWLHTQGIPGSHVLIKRTAGREVPPEVVEEAARLAVLHSRAKGSSNVPVFLAEARHVSKFKGAKPGLVRIAKYRTINVR